MAAEQQVLAKPEASEEVVGALRRRSERTRKLVERGNGWQQFLFDGIDQLIADVKHDLAGPDADGRARRRGRHRRRATPRRPGRTSRCGCSARWCGPRTRTTSCSTSGPRSWPPTSAETFALESDEPLQLGLTAPRRRAARLDLRPGPARAPDSQKLVRMLFAGRAALIPATVAGSVASAAGGLLLLAAAAPVVASGWGSSAASSSATSASGS